MPPLLPHSYTFSIFLKLRAARHKIGTDTTARFADRAQRWLKFVNIEVVQHFALHRDLVAKIPGTMKKMRSVVPRRKNVVVNTNGEEPLTRFVSAKLVRF